MKAAAIQKFGSIDIIEMPMPKPGDYEALCELLYGAVCTGTDSHIVQGCFPWTSPLPTVLGHESIGRVIELGPKVRNFRIGDLVTRVGTPPSPKDGISVTWGGFAEFGIAKDHWAMQADGLPAAQWHGSRVNQVIPPGIAPSTAPMLTTWRENLSFLNRLGVKSGSSVLIGGSGGNGLSFARLASNLGAFVALAGAPYLQEAALAKSGASLYFDYKRKDLAEAVNAAKPEGFDFVVDAVGKSSVAESLLPCLKEGGVYSAYGIDELGQILINPAKARGGFRIHPCSYDEAETHQQATEWVLQGRLAPDLWYDEAKPYKLSEINEAFADLKARKSPKALIKLS